MPTNYPGSLDNLPRPSASTQMNTSGYEGSSVIDNLSDAVESIEAELGTDPAGGAATVRSRLDVLTGGLVVNAWPTTGYYYAASQFVTTRNTNAAQGADFIRYAPFVTPSTATLAALVCNVATGATGNIRMGVYENTFVSGLAQPGALLVDAGTASTSTLGYKEIATTQQLQGNRLYWLASVLDASITMVCINASLAAVTNTSGTAVRDGFSQSYTYGALPSSASSLSAIVGGNFLCMWVKL